MDQQNTLTSAELNRQLQLQASRAPVAEASALQWLLALPPSTSPRSKAEIDAELATERDW